MKKILLFSVIAVGLAAFSSCTKLFTTCQCEAVGYGVSQSTLNAALQAHKNDCTSIADNGPIYDSYYDVEISCSY